ncbi:Rz1-like lysis system protein LysC [Aureimonas sp. N4]|uniref:Rz1-like lysis system protein LysC n=1 Tax=Aureimonas sp. N4 TaxID=1638165 RepID=UPI000783F13E|nr:hypothetical protein [Aureimonas sp. N4]
MPSNPRRLSLAALLLAVLLSQSGCATRSPVSVPPRLPTVPQTLLLACADPVALPDRDLTTAETVRLWGRDRASLGECRDRHEALGSAVTTIQSQGQP